MGKIDFLEGLDSSRLLRLLREAIERLELDLTGARVLTEAGSRQYAVTPIIAALAGAEVYALTRDSAYASVSEVQRQVAIMADVAGIGTSRIHILTDREWIPTRLDLITNLGFVRPVDAALIDRLGPNGVVSYMCEAWEMREGDIDFVACETTGVPVAGVWEDFDGLDIFRSCGQLALKLCFEAGLEVAGNRLILISPDQYGPVIESALEANLAKAFRLASAADLTEVLVANADAIIVADYNSEDTILGAGSGPSAAELAGWNPGLQVIQFAGCNNVAALTAVGLRLFPKQQLVPRRMAFTLAHLGVRPTMLLHAAGLKVGELLWGARAGAAVSERFRRLVQPMNAAAERLYGLPE